MDHGEDNYRALGGPLDDTTTGQRIDILLAKKFPFLSREGWQKRLEVGHLLVNGRAVKSSYRVRVGDGLLFFHPQAIEPEVDTGIEPLWEKAGVMAVYKPGNLPMHENGPYRKNTFTELLRTKIGSEWAAVHRLDRETSGIVLCGATPTIRNSLAEDFASGRIRKTYQAIAKGHSREPAFTVDAPIGDLQKSAIRIKKWVVVDGQEARTEFIVDDQCHGHTLLRAFPRTGRTNQIRIHAAYVGLPLVGDKLYHPDENVFLDYFSHGNEPSVWQRTGFYRLCLHAAELSFCHPALRERCLVESPLPEDLHRLWRSLKNS